MKKIHIPPLGWLARFADWFMVPVMYLLSGTFKESPQRTHWWNKMTLPHGVLFSLNKSYMVHCGGIKGESERTFLKLPLFHMPIFGGWKKYVVLESFGYERKGWYVGWVTEDAIDITRLTLKGPVRKLLGPKDIYFFGINKEGKQIPLTKIGEGTIGEGYLRVDIPLL